MNFNHHSIVFTLFLATTVSYTSTANADWYSQPPLIYTGVNLAGAEFGDSNLPGTYGSNYTYPNTAEFDYFASKNINIIRLPFRWERLQHSIFADFNISEFNRLDTAVQSMLDRGMVVILDPHNYARYYGDLIGSTNVPSAAFSDFWSRLATNYRNQPGVWFGLINEPYGIDATNWLPIANSAIVAIRNTGAKNRILIPGTAWSGAHSWTGNWYGTPNGSVMDQINDPENNFIIEVHQYLDSDSSGTHDSVVSSTIGSQRLAVFTQWCRTRNIKAFLGEFACPRSNTGNLNDTNYTGYCAIDDLCSYMENNNDVWVGWTWWAAGPWWHEYMFTLEPDSNTDRPQLSIALNNHIMQHDRDNDGISDAWEISHFGNTGTDPDSDPDSDGLSNLDEYIAGTAPTIPTPASLSISTTNSICQITYNTIRPEPGLYLRQNRSYSLYTTTNLNNNSWTPVPEYTNISTDYATISFNTNITTSSKFFMLEIHINQTTTTP